MWVYCKVQEVLQNTGGKKGYSKNAVEIIEGLYGKKKYINYFVNTFNYKIIYNVFTSYMENISLRMKTMLENIKEK